MALQYPIGKSWGTSCDTSWKKLANIFVVRNIRNCPGPGCSWTRTRFKPRTASIPIFIPCQLTGSFRTHVVRKNVYLFLLTYITRWTRWGGQVGPKKPVLSRFILKIYTFMYTYLGGLFFYRLWNILTTCVLMEPVSWHGINFGNCPGTGCSWTWTCFKPRTASIPIFIPCQLTGSIRTHVVSLHYLINCLFIRFPIYFNY